MVNFFFDEIYLQSTIVIIDKQLVINYVCRLHYGLPGTLAFKNRSLDSMQASTHRTVNHLWLPLLAVIVFSVVIDNPVCWAGSQQQQFELESEVVPEPSKDGTLLTGFIPGLFGNGFLPLQTLNRRLTTIAGSDACPGFILHGPPAPDYPV